MEAKDKELLIKDLCARLPYNVFCQFNDNCRVIDNLPQPIYDGVLSERSIDLFRNHVGFDIKPYLRPMSSMTDVEKEELSHYEDSVQRTDFFYSHNIDCRFMIEKGLALEAPEGMYNV